jgi:hypothetical protein
MLLSKTGIDAAAINSIVWNNAVITISIPAGKGGTLRAVEFVAEGVRETVVTGGGVVRLRNSSADWEPFYFLTAAETAVTEGGDSQVPVASYVVEKELPGNSDVYVDFRPWDNQDMILCATLIWELGAKPTQETFSNGIFPLFAAAVTAVARASPGNFAVPGGKGGRVFELCDLPISTLETVVCGGGMRELENDATDITPCEVYTDLQSTVGASGGGAPLPKVTPWDCVCPPNSTFTSWYTPVDDQAQILNTLVRWKRPIRYRVS